MADDMGQFVLGINTGFAVNRYAEPEEWARIVGEELGLSCVQLTADMLNVDLPASIIANQANRIGAACERAGVSVTSTFTGGFTRVNHMAHPDPEVRAHWISWFKRFADLSVDLGATAMGSHFGIFTHADNSDPDRREERLGQNIEGWHEVAAYAGSIGLRFLTWEPMSISREQGETIAAARELQRRVNDGSPIPIKICLDVDHGDVMSPNPDDTNPYAWLAEFGAEAPQIHLKQSSSTNKGGHWPFTAAHNAEGKIQPERVLQTLRDAGMYDAELLLELSFREREPVDSTVVSVLKESVDFWKMALAA